jgi:hypothetical protein
MRWWFHFDRKQEAAIFALDHETDSQLSTNILPILQETLTNKDNALLALADERDRY